MATLHEIGRAWDEMQPAALKLALRAIMGIALTVAAPFFAFALLFLLLDWSFWWMAVPAALGALAVLLGVGAWLFVWRMLRKARRHLATAAEWERSALGAQVVIDEKEIPDGPS